MLELRKNVERYYPNLCKICGTPSLQYDASIFLLFQIFPFPQINCQSGRGFQFVLNGGRGRWVSWRFGEFPLSCSALRCRTGVLQQLVQPSKQHSSSQLIEAVHREKRHMPFIRRTSGSELFYWRRTIGDEFCGESAINFIRHGCPCFLQHSSR